MWSPHQFENIVRERLRNIKSVKLMMDAMNPSMNRYGVLSASRDGVCSDTFFTRRVVRVVFVDFSGFGFLYFHTPEDAAAAFYYLTQPDYMLDGIAIATEYTEPLAEPVRRGYCCCCCC